MRFEIVTLFPELFDATRLGLLGKARDAGHLEIATLNPREFTTDRHRTVDDSPYGGGSGMVLMVGPLAAALEHLDEARRGGPSHKVLLTPQGERFCQSHARRFSEMDTLTLICGRYEGFDERIRGLVDQEISLGDFVLLGGEVAALAIIEAVGRLVPGVLGNEQSATEESHARGLLEYPQFTRPELFRGQRVPEVLLSGNHAAIARWRRKESLRRTLERRPDLLQSADLSEEDETLLAEVRAERDDDGQRG
jgi:tRNA (guanine37-N1)-methyltransferase